MDRKKVIDLLKTGNFTIAYHDNGDCRIYKGHKTYEECEKEIYSPEENYDGYTPEIVEMLVRALQGEVESI